MLKQFYANLAEQLPIMKERENEIRDLIAFTKDMGEVALQHETELLTLVQKREKLQAALAKRGY